MTPMAQACADVRKYMQRKREQPMSLRDEAERIIFEARNLKESDAIDLIEARLRHLFIRGEKAGIEAAAQSIRGVGERVR